MLHLLHLIHQLAGQEYWITLVEKTFYHCSWCGVLSIPWLVPSSTSHFWNSLKLLERGPVISVKKPFRYIMFIECSITVGDACVKCTNERSSWYSWFYGSFYKSFDIQAVFLCFKLITLLHYLGVAWMQLLSKFCSNVFEFQILVVLSWSWWQYRCCTKFN